MKAVVASTMARGVDEKSRVVGRTGVNHGGGTRGWLEWKAENEKRWKRWWRRITPMRLMLGIEATSECIREGLKEI